MALKRDMTTGEAMTDERRAIVLGQLFTIQAIVLFIASRWGNTYRDVAHILGIDSLILAAVVHSSCTRYVWLIETRPNQTVPLYIRPGLLGVWCLLNSDANPLWSEVQHE